MGEANSSPVQAYMTYPVPYQANEPDWHLPTHSTHLRIHTSTRPSRSLLYPLLMRRSYIYSSLLVTHPLQSYPAHPLVTMPATTIPPVAHYECAPETHEESK